MRGALAGGFVALLAFDLSAHPQQATKPDYRLYAGSGEEPCESLLAHARAVTAAPRVYDWCDVPIDLKDSRFTQPDWRTLDWRENLEIVEQIFVRGEDMQAWQSMYRSSHPDHNEAFDVVRREYWPPLRAKVVNGFETGQAHLQAADFDIDNDGKVDRVVRMTSWNVLPSPAEDGKLAASQRDIRFSTSCYPGTARYRYFRMEEMPDIYHASGLGKYLPFDGYLFQFNGKTYFGLSPDNVSLTFRGTGRGPSLYLWGDHGERKNRCGIIAD